MPAFEDSLYAAHAPESRVPEISVTEYKERLDSGDDLLLLDVRDPHEWEITAIDGSLRIPMSDILEHMGELDTARELVVHCKTGVRSGKVVEMLISHGYTKLHNLRGGIIAWAEEIDPSLPTY
jgi:adenylyltransferase/sulfurtransferase